MRVFVTGVAGFLGSHIADEFLAAGYSVRGCDNYLGGYEDNVPNEVDFHFHDLRNMEGLSKLMEDCDIVFHTACTAYEGLSVFSPSLVCENTSQISVNAMTAAIVAGVGKFVHCSSMARYGRQDITPFVETMACKPQDPYGIAKYSAELLLSNLAEVHGIQLVIAVPHNIVGPRQKYDDPYRNVAGIMINLMLQGRQPVIYGNGSQVRCFSDVRDDLSCLTAMATDDCAIGNVFNIGPDEEEISILTLAEVIADLIGFSLDPIFVPGRPQEVEHATCSADKIREYFGYETRYSLRESIQSMINYVDSRGVKPFKYHLPLEIISAKTPETWSKRLF